MIHTLIASVMLSGALTSPEEIRCEFPGMEMAEPHIIVKLVPRPSLKDQPGAYRVIMDLNETVVVRAAATPIESTEERDVLIRGMTKRQSLFTIGLREDGKAALNMQTRSDDSEEVSKSTRVGQCSGFEAHIERWLLS